MDTRGWHFHIKSPFKRAAKRNFLAENISEMRARRGRRAEYGQGDINTTTRRNKNADRGLCLIFPECGA